MTHNIDLVAEAAFTWRPILPRRDGRFDPVEHEPGQAPDAARADMAAQLPAEDAAGEIVDLVAWFVTDPCRWWTRKGVATILGERAIVRAGWNVEPVNLYRTPGEWLHASAGGDDFAACIVDWQADPRLMFGCAQEVRCISAKLRQRLEARVRECARPSFKISTARTNVSVAA